MTSHPPFSFIHGMDSGTNTYTAILLGGNILQQYTILNANGGVTDTSNPTAPLFQRSPALPGPRLAV
jgi:hypothetical protein